MDRIMARNETTVSIPSASGRKTRMPMKGELSATRRVVIAGATSGLGLTLAQRFIAAGWTVGATGRNAEALAALQKSAPDHVTT